MKIIGLTVVRNESLIIQDTLDHLATFCDRVFVLDDASEDSTPDICIPHPAVAHVICKENWNLDKPGDEPRNRQAVLRYAQQDATPQDWFVYVNADERIEFDWSILNTTAALAVRMKLFDFYITPADVNKRYSERELLGPEFRQIIMAFKNSPVLSYTNPVQREPRLPRNANVLKAGYVRHYGKAISVAAWEAKCDYYVAHYPCYRAKWRARKGHAVHTTSDQGRALIRWQEKDTKGIPLR